MSARNEFETGKDLVRARLLKFTRRAFKLITHLDKPRILDIGCGSGVVTMGLAILSNGWITALDINEYDLDRLAAKVRREELSERVTVVKRSMMEMNFDTESFDIIWSEGSIYIIGFESGLREWKRLLKPN